jgi:hypothetical protein
MGASPSPTFRIRLEREDTGATICTWGRISGERIAPMVRSLKATLPYMVAAARAKRAFAELLEAIR